MAQCRTVPEVSHLRENGVVRSLCGFWRTVQETRDAFSQIYLGLLKPENLHPQSVAESLIRSPASPSLLCHYFRLWRLDGTWEYINAALRERVERQAGRDLTLSAAIIDSQSVKTTEKGGRAATMGARS